MSSLFSSEQINKLLRAFEQILINKNTNAVSELFQDDFYWRDFVVFTWNIKTCEGHNQISNVLGAILPNVKLVN